MRARVGFAAGGDVGMSVYPLARNVRISPHKRPGNLRQLSVLSLLKGGIIRSFQFNADGEIIYPRATLANGLTGMPSAHVQGHELDHFTVPPDQQVCGDLLVLNFPIVRMLGRIQRITEQSLDPGSAEFPRW